MERLIQLMVEVATDINNTLLKSLGRGPTADSTLSNWLTQGCFQQTLPWKSLLLPACAM
ncbi:MAG TPA: hypothetical protein GX504_02965 [Clostridia bacterium]|nr:hypothetical protein [Clostridia bacterium]